MPKLPKQQLPVIDPNPSADEKHVYYLLVEPQSPSVTPANAVEVVQYQLAGQPQQQYLHDDPDDFDRRPWGYVVYDHELSFEEIDAYKLLHWNPVDRALFDLWISFGKDKVRLLLFCTQFFGAIEDDPERLRLVMATKLVAGKWTLARVRKEIKGIK